MKISSFVLLALALPLPLAAQVAPPARLAELETARTRRCVPALARLAAVSADLEPLARRAERIQALAAAVSLEDTTAVAPFDVDDPLELAVRDWFAADRALALEYLDSGDESLPARRDEGRQQIRQQLDEALQELAARGQERMGAEEDLQVARECEDAILVRSVVLEVCETTESPVCDAAESPEITGRFRFVEAPGDLWDVESLRPWSEPSRLGLGPAGGLAGARTGALSRRGNLVLMVGIEPMIQSRSALTAEQATALEAGLDSLGYTFEHPEFVMAPALAIRLDVPGVLDGETHYFLHFGDLSEPTTQVVWSAPAAGPVQAVVPVPGTTLERLAAGEPLSLTAARLPEGGSGEGQAVYTLGLTPVGQARAVASLVGYMAGGQLGRDFATLVPPAAAPADSGG